MGDERNKAFRVSAGLAAGAAVVGFMMAALLPTTFDNRRGAFLGVLLAVVTGVVSLGLKRRAVRRDLKSAMKVVGVMFAVRAVSVVLGLVWVVRQDLGVVGFVAGFFGTYFVLQWIELSYVMAATKSAAGGDE